MLDHIITAAVRHIYTHENTDIACSYTLIISDMPREAL
jgi:hypothetical protein